VERSLASFDRITVDPGRLDGQPCVRGYRFSVEHLLDFLAAGWGVDEVQAEFPFIGTEEIRQALQFAVGSGRTIDGDLEGGADVAHAGVAQAAEAFDEDRDRDALDRVQVHGAAARHRIVAGLEDDLAWEVADRGGARGDQGAPQPRDRRVSGQDDDWAAGDVGELAPPDLSPAR